MQIQPDSIHNSPLGIYTQQMERSQVERSSVERPHKGAVSESRQDRVSLSGQGLLMAEAVRTAHNTPDVREDRVAYLKARVDAGTYTVDNTALATALVRDHLSLWDISQNSSALSHEVRNIL